jgi:hypothetical protein
MMASGEMGRSSRWARMGSTIPDKSHSASSTIFNCNTFGNGGHFTPQKS